MRELGHVEGKNLAIEWRFAEGKYERLPGLAAELVQLKVDVIVTAGTPATSAAQKATTTIPIVMGTVGDPVGSGFVKSLARPGGNITGLSELAVDLSPKLLEMLISLVLLSGGRSPRWSNTEAADTTLTIIRPHINSGQNQRYISTQFCLGLAHRPARIWALFSSLGIRRFGRAEYKNRNRCRNPDTNTKTCPDSNANANVSNRYTDTCTEYNANEYAQRQSSRTPA